MPESVQEKVLDGKLLAELVRSGAANLSQNVQKVNDLNVFPIPDGDTGDNMLLTMKGGANASLEGCDSLSDVSRRISEGMLLGARGNSGVILSQFFEGFASAFSGMITADTDQIKAALRKGVEYAYNAVVEPTEGTILTVMREATEYTYTCNATTPGELLGAFIEEAKRSLKNTPEKLDVLKKAGVVDSGGAGLVYIAEGIRQAYNGQAVSAVLEMTAADKKADVNFDLFDENSVMKYGYCTELLLRLQRCKVDPDTFNISVIIDYLKTIGNSVVAFKTGTAVKLHVHTMTPEKVFEFCHQFGEFLTVKVENMSLQHSGTDLPDGDEFEVKKDDTRRKFGVVAVATGKGIQDTFREMGADFIVEGGQSMNPSTSDFIEAFEAVNADTVIVFPNNGNVILTARQAAKLYPGSDVRVVESKTIGHGYAALTMLNTDGDDVDAIMAELDEAMAGVVNVEISRAVRDADMDGFTVHTGDYIGFTGKQIVSCSGSREQAVYDAAEKINLSEHSVCMLIRGAKASDEETEKLVFELPKRNGGVEVYRIDGGQDIYDYILGAE